MTPEREKEIREYSVNKYPAQQENKKRLRELLEEIDSLRESIKIYGGHIGGCGCLEYYHWKGPIPECSCGFRAIYLKAIENERTESNQCPSKQPGSV